MRFDKLKIATACGELAENTLTFIDLISKAVICIYIYRYTDVQGVIEDKASEKFKE